MKCQSDYDREKQAELRQADECVEEWWEPGAQQAKPSAQTESEAAAAPATVAQEALRRGLLKEDEKGDTCLSCPGETSREDTPK
jgi:hypothetical protein